jgi:ABC-type uncharacterized transport system permease subunit
MIRILPCLLPVFLCFNSLNKRIALSIPNLRLSLLQLLLLLLLPILLLPVGTPRSCLVVELEPRHKLQHAASALRAVVGGSRWPLRIVPDAAQQKLG